MVDTKYVQKITFKVDTCHITTLILYNTYSSEMHFVSRAEIYGLQ